MRALELDIDGMSCDACVRTVQGALKSVPGVRGAQVTIGHAVVEIEDHGTPDSVVRAIEESGYKVSKD